MNCFEWQNRASDYLDGTLIGTLKQGADEHLENCETCSERYKHFRLILASVSAQPRTTLPVPVRGAPLTAALPKVDLAHARGSRWERIPWMFRTAIEATTIVLLILAAIATGPRLRALYDRGIEQNLSELSQAFSDMLHPDPTIATEVGVPLARGKSAESAQSREERDDEFISEEEGEDESPPPASKDSDVHVGNSEVWRFIIKTDSPHEYRTRIVGILTTLKISKDTPGLGGVEAPGGIQFDLLLPKALVPGLKRQLQSIAPPAPESAAKSPMSETFTWFKNKSKRQIPEGRTRVVIWLSQM
ncbi:MAG: zf-HC2 domain-containing protein [Oligoflexia bacterium]|nr:zf-HC2 domain-containing protein [Oligoflexia bacterium]